jgi:hypothetical protein
MKSYTNILRKIWQQIQWQRGWKIFLRLFDFTLS